MEPDKWRKTSNIKKMVQFFHGLSDFQGEERKWLLFGVACCRRLDSLLLDKRLRKAVEVAEQFADGKKSRELFQQAGELASEAYDDVAALKPQFEAAAGAVMNLMEQRHPIDIGNSAANALLASRHSSRSQRAEKVTQAEMLRDMFGNPSRLHALFGHLFQPIMIEASWLSANNSAVPRLAETIYEQRRFQDMPILADALEEAGCSDEAILAHCRGPGIHTRGCWVLDVLLGWEMDGEWELCEDEE